MKKIKDKWNAKKPHEKKSFIMNVSFLALGLLLGIIYLIVLGWNFKKFITNPTVDLIILGAIAYACMRMTKEKKGSE